MSIVLHGSFQGNNFGDTLLLKVYSDYLRNEHKIKNIYATNTSRQASIFCRVTRISKYRALKFEYPIVFCGGGYLGEPPWSKFRWQLKLWKRHLLFGLIAAIKKSPYSVLGVGFGPLTGFWVRYPVLFFLKRSFSRCFRDKESIDFLKQYSRFSTCTQATDAILSCSPEYLRVIAGEKTTQPKDSNGNIKKIILHIPGDTADAMIRRTVCKKLNELLSMHKNYSVVVVSDNSSYNASDYFSWIDQSDELQIKKSNYDDPSSLLREVVDAHAIVTTKLHVGICGAVLGKTVLSLARHSKTARLYNQLGRPDVCFRLNSLSEDLVEGLLLKLINGKIPPLKVSSQVHRRSLKIWHHLDSFLLDNKLLEV